MNGNILIIFKLFILKSWKYSNIAVELKEIQKIF